MSSSSISDSPSSSAIGIQRSRSPLRSSSRCNSLSSSLSSLTWLTAPLACRQSPTGPRLAPPQVCYAANTSYAWPRHRDVKRAQRAPPVTAIPTHLKANSTSDGGAASSSMTGDDAYDDVFGPDFHDNKENSSRSETPEDVLSFDWASEPSKKPPFAYATLIFMALRECDKDKLSLSEIYDYVLENFAYYRHARCGWKNSIRHNLSQEECFIKVDRDDTERGKGGYWMLNPNFVDFDQMMTRRRRKFKRRRSHLNSQAVTARSSVSSSVPSTRTSAHSNDMNVLTKKGNSYSGKADKTKPKGGSKRLSKRRGSKAARAAKSKSKLTQMSNSPNSRKQCQQRHQQVIADALLEEAALDSPSVTPSSSVASLMSSSASLVGSFAPEQQHHLPSCSSSRQLSGSMAPTSRKDLPGHSCKHLDSRFGSVLRAEFRDLANQKHIHFASDEDVNHNSTTAVSAVCTDASLSSSASSSSAVLPMAFCMVESDLSLSMSFLGLQGAKPPSNSNTASHTSNGASRDTSNQQNYGSGVAVNGPYHARTKDVHDTAGPQQPAGSQISMALEDSMMFAHGLGSSVSVSDGAGLGPRLQRRPSYQAILSQLKTPGSSFRETTFSQALMLEQESGIKNSLQALNQPFHQQQHLQHHQQKQPFDDIDDSDKPIPTDWLE